MGKYFIASGYNKFTSAILHAKIKQNELANRSYISNLLKIFNLDTKIATLAIRLAIESVVVATRLPGWVQLGEIWQLNIWI